MFLPSTINGPANLVRAIAGALATPSISFSAETTLGFYRRGANNIGLSSSIFSIGDGTTTTSAASLNFGDAAANFYRHSAGVVVSDGIISSAAYSGTGTFRSGDGGSNNYQFGRDNITTGDFVVTFGGTRLWGLTSGGQVTLSTAANNTGSFQLYAADNASPAALIRINATQANLTAADVFINFSSTSGIEGSVAGTAVAGVIAYNTFTGAHFSQSNVIIPTQLESTWETVKQLEETGEVDEKGNPVMETTEEDVELKRFTSNVEPGAVLISIDELCEWDGEVAQTLPKVAVSSIKEDKAVYGVYGGHDRDGDIIVLAVGTGLICVTNEGGDIEVGDFLCTSSTLGCAMKYTGSDMRVVIAKARESWTNGQGKIACTLLAG